MRSTGLFFGMLVTGLLSFATTANEVEITTQDTNAQDSNCEVRLEANDRMQFVQKQLFVSSTCETVTVSLQHIGKLPATVMGHNVVVALASDMQGIVADSFKAGVANHYVAPGDERVIAVSKVIGGGETTRVSFAVAKLDPAQRYVFFCAAPGHWVMMKGELVISR